MSVNLQQAGVKRQFILVTLTDNGKQLVPVDRIITAYPASTKQDDRHSVLLLDGMQSVAVRETTTELDILIQVEWAKYIRQTTEVLVLAAQQLRNI